MFLSFSFSFLFPWAAILGCPQMAWVHQYYICLKCNFKDKLCSLFLLPFHCRNSHIHNRVRLWWLRLWKMSCSVPICVLTLFSLSFYPLHQFPHLIYFLCWLPFPNFHQALYPIVPPLIAKKFSCFLASFFPDFIFCSFYLLSISWLHSSSLHVFLSPLQPPTICHPLLTPA